MAFEMKFIKIPEASFKHTKASQILWDGGQLVDGCLKYNPTKSGSFV